MWGLAVPSKERTEKAKKENLTFGVVIRLKHTKGINKINDFKHACLLRGYIVNEIKIDNQIELYEKNQEEIKFKIFRGKICQFWSEIFMLIFHCF